MKLSCAVVGEIGGAFEVDIDAGASVSALKEAIKFEKQSKLKDVDANKIQLFLAKKGKAWLSDDNVVLQSGDVSSYKTMRGSWKLNHSELFGSGVLPTEKLVHVLVVVPMEFSRRKKQKVGDVELMHFTTNEQAELDAICKFGQGLTREDLFKGALLKVPHKVLRVNLSGGLYVRQEYWDVHMILNEGLQPDDRVLVIGSPGIGKSVFGVFLLLLFMSERKNVAYRPFGIDAKTFFFTWNVIEKRYGVSSRPVSTNLYEGLFDGGEYGAAWAVTAIFVHSYMFAGPRTKTFNQFVKEKCARIYMNPWAKDKCQTYVDAVGLERDEWLTRFSLVGGNPRLLFSSKQTMSELKNEVSKAIPMDFTKLEYVMRGVERGKFSDMMRNTLFEMYRDVENPGQCFLQFASDIIYTMVSTTYHGERNYKIRELLQTSDSNLQA